MTKEDRRSIPFRYKLSAGMIVLIGAFVAAMVFGAADTTLSSLWRALVTRTADDYASVIREIRLPREIAAAFVGAALAVSGAVMQGMTRNPLADPGLFGLTAGANAALAITLALAPATHYLGITISCFIGAGVGAVLVLGISAAKRGGLSPLRIVLAGAAVTAFLNAVAEGTGLYFKLSKDVSMWTAGGMIGTSWSQLHVVVPFIALGIAVALFLSRQLTVLSLSEEVAVGLGQQTTGVKTVLFIVVIVLCGSSVALAGNIAFFGLMVPHIVRAVVGTDYRFIVPMSAILGAAFMLLADTLGRTVNAPYETPVAAIVAMMGLPFFLFIVRTGGKAFS